MYDIDINKDKQTTTNQGDYSKNKTVNNKLENVGQERETQLRLLNKYKKKSVISLENIITREINEKCIYKKINFNEPLYKIYNKIFTRRNYAKYHYFRILFQEKFFKL